jgi:TatD DNase family protein
MLVDTHCHLHDNDFYSIEEQDKMYNRALACGVEKIICVGTDVKSSMQAINFSLKHEGAFAAVGIYPTDNSDVNLIKELISEERVVAIGEIGLDYHEDNIDKSAQRTLLEAQLQIASDNNMPVSFHVRNAFNDFWPILNNFKNIRGVLHSFTDSSENMERALSLKMFIGVNGISTFTKNESQIDLFKSIPEDSLLLETDAPFLTPTPYRGKINEPAFVRYIATHLAEQRNTSLNELASATTKNAHELFGL